MRTHQPLVVNTIVRSLSILQLRDGKQAEFECMTVLLAYKGDPGVLAYPSVWMST